MKKADRCCIDCIHFEKDKKECHRYPPVKMIRNVNGLIYPEWPTVDITDWCGEFKGE